MKSGRETLWSVCEEESRLGDRQQMGIESEPQAADEGSRVSSGILLRLCLLRLVLEIWEVLLFLGLTAEEACTCGILT